MVFKVEFNFGKKAIIIVAKNTKEAKAKAKKRYGVIASNVVPLGEK